MAASADRAITLHRWRENAPLYAEPLTGLPTHLGPWSMRMTRANGVWALVSPIGEETPIGTKDPFVAYRAMVDAYEAWFYALPKKHVYFMGRKADHLERIKIGVALDPESRLQSIQTGNPERLKVLAKVEGDESVEREYHRRFARQRRVGEWFVVNQAILDEIARLSAMENIPLPSPATDGGL